MLHFFLEASIRFARKYKTAFRCRRRTEIPLVVYDVMGRVVRRLIDRTMEPGYKTRTLRTATLPSGPYVYRLRAGDFVETKTFTVLH